MLKVVLFCAILALVKAGNISQVTNEQLSEIKGKIASLDMLLNEVKESAQPSSSPSNPPSDRSLRQVEEIFIDDERLNLMRPDLITDHIYMSSEKKKRSAKNNEASRSARVRRCGGGQGGRPKGNPPPGWRPRTTTAKPAG